MFGVFVAISSRSDITTQSHHSCQGLLGLFSQGVKLSCERDEYVNHFREKCSTFPQPGLIHFRKRGYSLS